MYIHCMEKNETNVEATVPGKEDHVEEETPRRTVEGKKRDGGIRDDILQSHTITTAAKQ